MANARFFDLVIDEAQSSWRTADAVAMVIEDMNTIPGVDMVEEEALMMQRSAMVIDPRTVRVDDSNLANEELRQLYRPDYESGGGNSPAGSDDCD